MGDRASVQVIERISESGEKVGVHLYSHWDGHALPIVVRDALKREVRWTDPSYLARIIFCEMITGQEAGETGFGIQLFGPGDAQYPTVIVDALQSVVQIGPNTWPMRDYIALKDEDLSYDVGLRSALA